jgi:RHS repeat-associated protein
MIRLARVTRLYAQRFGRLTQIRFSTSATLHSTQPAGGGRRGAFAAVSAFGVGSAILFWLVVTSAVVLVTPNVAQAVSGECVWEGGPGAPTHAYCALEDCVGDGGRAYCTEPPEKPVNSDERSDGEKWEYHFGDLAAYGPWVPAWCNAAGGTWSYPNCLGVSAGHGPNWANNEGTANSTSDAFANIIYGASCSINSSDSGWGATGGTCSLASPESKNGESTTESKCRVYTLSGSGCSGELPIAFFRERKIECEDNYSMRTHANGDVHCFIPAKECCAELTKSNPVSLVDGAKLQQEVDYRAGGSNPLEFRRFYNSKGFFRAPGTGPQPYIVTDYWHHNYDRTLIPVSGNSTLIAILHRADFSLQYFDGSGNEILNRNGGGAHIAFQSGVGWTLTLANGDVEHYDTSARLASITTRAGLTTTIDRDTLGRIETVTDHFGKELNFAYDTDGYLATVTDPAGEDISYDYDAEGRLLSVTYQDGEVKSYHYEDENGTHWLTGITDENGDRYSTYEYDQFGVVTVSEHAGGADRHVFAYYPNNTYNIMSVTDPLGKEHDHRTDNRQGVFKLTGVDEYCVGCGDTVSATYDSKGNIATRRNHRNYQTNYEFDQTRNLETSRTEGLWLGSSTPEARTITTTWHSTFRLPDVITEPDRVIDNDYDGDGNLTERTITDTATDEDRTWSYTYSSIGQLLTADGPRTDVSDETTYAYYECATGDECGQQYTVENAAGHITTFDEYDEHGRPTHITDPNGLETVLTYNLRGNIASRTVGTETTSYDYDDAQQLERETFPDGSYLEYTYDEAHRLVGIEDQDGNRIEYTLDAAGNRTEEEVYDPSSSLVRTLSREFDNRGRLVEEIGADNQTWEYEYDNNGNRTSATDPLGRITTYEYDPLDRLKTVTDAADGETAYTYTDQDLLASVEDPRSVLTTYEYDGWGDSIAQQSPDTGLTVFIRDQAGNVETRTDARSETGESSYDALQRIIATDYSDQNIDYVYDAGTDQLGRLTSLTDDAGTTTWSYDLHGRVLEREQVVNGKTHTVVYDYNAAGQLVSMETPSGQLVEYEYTDNRLTEIAVNSQILLYGATYEPFGPVNGWNWGNGSETSRTFDQDGRLMAITGAHSAVSTWDDAGRITAILDNEDPGRDRTFAYDELDRLILVIPEEVPDGGDPSLELSTTSANPGDTVTVTIDNVPIAASWLALSRTGDPETTYVTALPVNSSETEYDFTMPAYAGSYEARLFAGETFDLLAESATITVSAPSTPSSPTLVPNATAVAPSGQITVRLAGGYGGSTDWFAFAAASAPNSSYLNWTYVGSAVTARDWTITAPSTEGTYEFRLFLNNGYTLAATSVDVTVTDDPPDLPSGGGSIELSTTSAAPGASVTVTVDNVPTDSGHWLALARTSDANPTYRAWKGVYIGTASDQWNVTMPPFAGTYEIRLFDGDGFERDATSSPITVSAPSAPSQATLYSGAIAAGPGNSVTVRLMAGAGASSNWLALATVGAANTSYVAWTYVGTGVTDRDWTVNMPSTPGDYEFRYFTSGYTLAATSAPVEVTSDAPVGLAGGSSGSSTSAWPSYTHDDVGNRLTSVDAAGNDLEYVYDDDSNRLLSISGDESRTYSYDDAGNITGWGAGSLTYDGAGRLVAASGVQYFHNALGQRVRKRISSTESIYYVYDEGDHLLGEYDSDGELIQETVWLGDIPVATLRPASGGGIEIYYVHTDHLNTPRVITESTDNDVRWRWHDAAFGDSEPDEDPESLGVFEYNLRFPGQYLDDESGLHYNYFRDYDGATGRYIQSDPIGLGGGLNTYLYANANPLGYVDPYGEHAGSIVLPGLGGGAAAAGAGAGTGAGAAAGLGAFGAVAGAGLAGYGIGMLIYPHIEPWLSPVVDAMCRDSEEERCRKVLSGCREQCLDIFVEDPGSLPGVGSNSQARLRRCVRECMEGQGCFNF